jgi:hypothetical protein
MEGTKGVHQRGEGARREVKRKKEQLEEKA